MFILPNKNWIISSLRSCIQIQIIDWITCWMGWHKNRDAFDELSLIWGQPQNYMIFINNRLVQIVHRSNNLAILHLPQIKTRQLYLINLINIVNMFLDNKTQLHTSEKLEIPYWWLHRINVWKKKLEKYFFLSREIERLREIF